MTDLTELIEEREKSLAYFEKQLELLKLSDLSTQEREALKGKFNVRVTEIKDLLDMNYKQLKQEEKDKIFYSDPFGLWRVTTEGDEEGRSTEELGTYVGYLDYIAYHLAGKELYSLQFRKIPIQPYLVSTSFPERTEMVEVYVQLDINSGTWDSKDYRRRFFSNLLKDREHVIIEDGRYYATVKLLISAMSTVYKRTIGEVIKPKELN